MPNNKIQSLTVQGVTYDIVDNTSGYSKVHIVTYTRDYDEELEENYLTFDATYTEVHNWLSNGELVVLDSRATGKSYYPCGSDRGELIFGNADGSTIHFFSNNRGGLSESDYITIDQISNYESDPIFVESPAYNITSNDITNWNSKTSNTGTITSVKTTAGAHTAINVSSGAAEFNVPTKTSHLTNDSGFLTSFTETDPTVPAWAKAETKPSYTFSEIGSTPTTLSGYGITNAYTKTEIDGLVAGVLHYKGTKASVTNLPTTGNTTGDVWHITADGSEYAWDGTIWQELGTAIDLSRYATKATTLAGYEINDAKIENGTITLGSNSITPLTSFTETDPVFSASAAAGITSTDISNWNAKVSDDKTWNGVTLNKSEAAGNDNYYLTGIADGTTTSTTARLIKATVTPEVNRIPKYGVGAYLYSTTPSANDNSTKVATTAYVDTAIPDVSGFSTTDEKLKLESINENVSYHPILTTGNAIDVANTQFTDLYGISYTGGSQVSGLILGNDTSTTQSTGSQGRLTIYGTGTFFSRFIVGTLTANSILTLPNKTGTLALTSDIPKVYSSTNTGGYLTMATLPIYDGTVV